ncbi:MgtC/SapB family protein [uncultured Sphaerochaeta sp.]|uniref:MgtC/SapB family protein n=1 Tax=uncultured Sphaerochaeta sp. TaxID=886478 RepID=UPI002A0A2DCA|nr:MgtC/SapB family protein [uncultured Sphaerochaeta sp.]
MSFESIATTLAELNIVSIIVRLLLATVCGGLIGFERERMRRTAGLRTHILVCMGSALVMLVSQYIFTRWQTGDPQRMGAQVISGIGFLGAGTIMVTGRQQVKGLTTAAGLWTSACLGLAIGIGFYSGALIGCLFIVLVVTGMHRIDDAVVNRSPITRLYVELAPNGRFSKLFNDLKKKEWVVSSWEVMDIEKRNDVGMIAVLTLKTGKMTDHQMVSAEVSACEDVAFVDLI